MEGIRGKKSRRRNDKDSDWEAIDIADWENPVSDVYVSTGGRIISLDELLDIILDKDDKRKRKLAKG